VLIMTATTFASGAGDGTYVTGHPRLFFTPDELTQLRELRDDGLHAQIWANLADSAEWCLERPLRTEWIAPVTPDPIYENLYDRFYAMMHDMSVMEHLAFAYAYSGDERYGAGARDWTLACCRVWRREAEGEPDGGKAYAVSRLLKGLAVAYDCIHPLLEEAERAEIRDTIADIGQAYHDGYFTTPSIAGPGFHTHHAIVEWASFGLAALAILGEYEGAEDWLDVTVTKLEEHLLPMGLAADGAQVEGATFWASTMQYRLFFMDAVRRVAGHDMYEQFAGSMNADLALAAIAAQKTAVHDENDQTVILSPSYGQVNYYAPVLLALAREYRRPVYQRLALWDGTLGSIQRTRYVTSNGEQLLFELGGYAYAWYDPAAPAEPIEAPLSFMFKSVNEAYIRDSYEPGGIVAGVRKGRVVVHAGGQAVLVDTLSPAAKDVDLHDGGPRARISCSGDAADGFASQSVRLTRPGRLTVYWSRSVRRTWWSHTMPERDGNRLTWADGTTLTVERGSIGSVEPDGFVDEKIVGMGKLKLVDPLPKRYPLVTVEPDENGDIVVRVVFGSGSD
jgi:hypothetical protein